MALLLSAHSFPTGFTLLGQWWERKAKRRKMLLAQSVKMAMAHRESLIQFAQMTNQQTYIPEQARLVHTYFIALNEMIDSGSLPRGIFAHDSLEEKAAFQSKHERQ